MTIDPKLCQATSLLQALPAHSASHMPGCFALPALQGLISFVPIVCNYKSKQPLESEGLEKAAP